MDVLNPIPTTNTWPLSDGEILHLLQCSLGGIPPALDTPPVPPDPPNMVQATPGTATASGVVPIPHLLLMLRRLSILALGIGAVLLLGLSLGKASLSHGTVQPTPY